MEKCTILIDIVKESCNEAFDSIIVLSKRILFTEEYICQKFRALVFNDLAEKLWKTNYKYTQVYDCFIEVYYEEFHIKLLELIKSGIKLKGGKKWF